MEFWMPVLNLVDQVLPITGITDKINLPKIIVVGEQSAGKSSVLEAIAGSEFLPRDKALCTKCPILIEMTKKEGEEYAKFISPVSKEVPLDKIQQEIININSSFKEQIEEKEIHLRIYK